MLGAEEFGFATTLLMAEGCVMMRVCNLDTCPMGICTQNRSCAHFHGKPEYIINYLTFVAEELREYMAKLGVRTVDELVGRTDLLPVKEPAAPGSRASKMDLDCILHNPAIENSNVHFVRRTPTTSIWKNTLDMKVLDEEVQAEQQGAPERESGRFQRDRAFGAIFGSEITRKYGNTCRMMCTPPTARCRRPELRCFHPRG